jgi:hypothetical protein
VARHPDRIQPAVTLGDVYRLSGRIAEAEEIFRPLVDQKSTNSYVWSGWIRVLRDSNRQAEAEQMRTTACKRFPDVQYFRAPMTADPQVPVDVDAVTERKLSSPELAILRRRTVRLGSEGSDASAERAWLDERIEAADLAPITKQVERSLLALDDGRPQSALDRLTTARADLGETIPLLYALARAEREQASADGTRFSTAGFRRAMEPLAALRMRTAAARPLATLSAVRLAYAMNDGPPLDERREQSVETLRSELAAGRVSDSAFDRWWSSLVGSQILRGPMAADGDVGELLGASQRILNELEEDAVTKIGCEGAAW